MVKRVQNHKRDAKITTLNFGKNATLRGPGERWVRARRGCFRRDARVAGVEYELRFLERKRPSLFLLFLLSLSSLSFEVS